MRLIETLNVPPTFSRYIFHGGEASYRRDLMIDEREVINIT